MQDKRTIGKLAGSLQHVDPQPVSYPHLDVYKRQGTGASLPYPETWMFSPEQGLLYSEYRGYAEIPQERRFDRFCHFLLYTSSCARGSGSSRAQAQVTPST